MSADLEGSPTTGEPWDLVVVGGGTAGIVGAKTAARLGARVLLVERERTGGDCLWTGCVPSKALLAAAGVAATARRGHRFGVAVAEVSVDFARVMDHVRATIQHIAPIDSIEALEGAGVSVRTGTARFVGPHEVEVEGRVLPFRQALVATGASPAVPAIPGLSEVDHLTSDTVWDLDELPEELVILGGGSIGCELGQAFARLGSQVAVVEGAPRILPREDPGAAAALADALVEDGVRLHTGSGVSRVEPTGSTSGVLHLESGQRVPFARLLVAVGRAPRTTGIGLAAAQVAVDDRGFVVVDDVLRTTNPHIWAAGDLTGHPQFTHTAGVHASLAASNAILGVRRKVDLSAIPRVTFTDPEVAAVGVGTDQVPAGTAHHRLATRARRPRGRRGCARRVHPAGRRQAGPCPGCHGGRAARRRDPRGARPGDQPGTHDPRSRRGHPRLPHLQRRTVERRDLRRPGPARAPGHGARPRSARRRSAGDGSAAARAHDRSRKPATMRWTALSPTTAAHTVAIDAGVGGNHRATASAPRWSRSPRRARRGS